MEGSRWVLVKVRDFFFHWTLETHHLYQEKVINLFREPWIVVNKTNWRQICHKNSWWTLVKFLLLMLSDVGHFISSGPPYDQQNHRFGWKSDMLYLWPIQIKNRKHDFWFLVPKRALRASEIAGFTQKCCQSGLPWWL